jgi:hypothetical protein
VRKELWFGFSLMAAIVAAVLWLLPPPAELTSGHLGMLMLALIVVAILLGFPTAFTLMGMGVLFAWLAYRETDPESALGWTLDLMVHRAYSVMYSDVLIAVPLFIFMGYLVERANLIERLFAAVHVALARLPGSLAVAALPPRRSSRPPPASSARWSRSWGCSPSRRCCARATACASRQA